MALDIPAASTRPRATRDRPAVPLIPQLSDWDDASLRGETLSRLWDVYQKTASEAVRDIAASRIDVLPQATSTQMRCSLWWTGLSRVPESLERDGCEFLLHRAALLIIQETPEFVGGSPLTDGREIMAKFVGAIELAARADLPPSGPVRAARLAAILRKMQILIHFDEPTAGDLADARIHRIFGQSLAERFVFVLLSLELTNLLPSHSLQLLRECESDALDAHIDDFVTSLQYHRCAVVVMLGLQDDKWQRLRPLLRDICQYHRRCQGDDERLICVPKPLLLLLNLERELLQQPPDQAMSMVGRLCDFFAQLQLAAPPHFPSPLIFNLALHLAADEMIVNHPHVCSRAAAWLARTDHAAHIPGTAARRARVQSTIALLDGVQAFLATDANDYAPFSWLPQTREEQKMFIRLERELRARGGGLLLPLLDALAYLDVWTTEAVQQLLTALVSAASPVDPLALAVAATAVSDAGIGAHAPPVQRALYAASAVAILATTVGLGSSDHHAADVAFVRAMFGPHLGVSTELSDDDRHARLGACVAFGKAVAAHPGGRAYAYMALSAAKRPDGYSRAAIEHIGDVVSKYGERGRRLLWHLLRDDARLSDPARAPQLAALVAAGYAFQKSRASHAALPAPMAGGIAAPVLSAPHAEPVTLSASQRVWRVLKAHNAAPPSFLVPGAPRKYKRPERDT